MTQLNNGLKTNQLKATREMSRLKWNLSLVSLFLLRDLASPQFVFLYPAVWSWLYLVFSQTRGPAIHIQAEVEQGDLANISNNFTSIVIFKEAYAPVCDSCNQECSIEQQIFIPVVINQVCPETHNEVQLCISSFLVVFLNRSTALSN